MRYYRGVGAVYECPKNTLCCVLLHFAEAVLTMPSGVGAELMATICNSNILKDDYSVIIMN